MTQATTAIPPVVSRSEWLAARKALLAKEKEATRVRDAVNAERRRLPMVRIEEDYVFAGPDGSRSLLDLFEGRRQLYVHHFMWVDERDEGCPACSMAVELNFTPPLLTRLHELDVAFAAISRAPLASITRFKQRRGWSFPWYSSHGSSFNHDFQVTLDESVAPVVYNYRNREELLAAGFTPDVLTGDWTGNSVFLRNGDTVFHTYSAYARSLDQLATPYNFLDLTPFGRQEDWEDSPAGFPQKPTYG
ncbi:MAG: DUF899 domain-containing protein [Pseudonocardia sp.]